MAEKLNAKTRIRLNDQNTIPCIGLGVFSSAEGAVCQRAVETALEAGYRHVDTAAEYGNEASAGRGIVSSGIPREEIFVTTKLWPGPDVKEVRGQLLASLEKLRSEYVDLYLIHWPIGFYREAWKILVELKQEGKCRSVGVSDCTVKRFETDFFPMAAAPAVNQIELHAFNQQRAPVMYCIDRGITLSAYSPLSRSEKLEDPVLKAVARYVGKSPAQVMIRTAPCINSRRIRESRQNQGEHRRLRFHPGCRTDGATVRFE